MTQNDRYALDALKAELNFIEKGGYWRSVKTPWQPTSIFQDSPICLNFADLERRHPCSQCVLIDFVPEGDRSRDVACHHIPLNVAGETIENLELREDQRVMEDTVKDWLRATIKRLGEKRARELLAWIT